MARLLFGSQVVHETTSSRRPSRGWVVMEKFRTRRWAWWLRRYTNVYDHLADLDDKTIAAIVGVGWLVWGVGAVIGPNVLGPAAWIIGVVLAVAGGYATWLVASWWLAYRRSGVRLRHEILARDPIARGRELDERISAFTLEGSAATIRPSFTDQAQSHGRTEAVAAMVLGDQAGQMVQRAAVAVGTPEAIGVLTANPIHPPADTPSDDRSDHVRVDEEEE